MSCFPLCSQVKLHAFYFCIVKTLLLEVRIKMAEAAKRHRAEAEKIKEKECAEGKYVRTKLPSKS